MGNFNSNNITSSSNKRSTESPVHHKKETAETQQQRQAAAKLALRKQLEKTLLQVHILHPSLTRAFLTPAVIFVWRCQNHRANNVFLNIICRSRHPNLLHQKCISSRTPRTRSLSTCAAWRSACRGSWTWTPRLRPSPCPSSARSAAQTSHPRGSGIKRPKVGSVIIYLVSLVSPRQSFDFCKYYCCLIRRPPIEQLNRVSVFHINRFND